MHARPQRRTATVCPLGWAALAVVAVFAVPGSAAGPYYLGLPAGWATVPAATRQQWLAETGARMPRVLVRLDLARQPGGEGHADAAVQLAAAGGATPLLALGSAAIRRVVLPDGREARTVEPAGLAEPVFASGRDESQPGDAINPANEWAWFVATVVERYDGDGLADAPGSPTATWYSVGDAPDTLPSPSRLTSPGLLPAWPGADFDRLARLVWVSRQAARFANAEARVGVQLSHPESLRHLLADRRHPAGGLLDFVDFRARGGAGSDGSVADPEGLAALADRYRAVLRQHGARAALLCGATGASALPHGGLIQRAAAPKAQLVAAARGLVTAQWAALCDPSPDSVGLVAPVGSRGAAWQPREAYYALATLGRLLGEDFAAGRVTFDEELPVGNDARCYRFDLAGADLVVAWAFDPDGDPTRRAEVRLPLRRDLTYFRYRWDYALTGEPGERLDAGLAGHVTALGIDPEYFLEGNPPRRCAPLVPPTPAPSPDYRVTASSADRDSPAAQAFDGDVTSAWRAAPGQRQPWWRVDFLDAPVTCGEVRLRVGRLPQVSWRVEVSDDGEVWRAVAGPLTSLTWDQQAVRLSSRVSSAHWRVVFDCPGRVPANLFEVRIGDRGALEQP